MLFIEVISTKFTVRLLILQDMVHDDENRVADGHDRSLFPSSSGKPPVSGGKVGVLRVTYRPGGFGQGRLHPFVSFSGTTAFSLPRTLVIARTYSGPGCEVLRAGKLSHIHPDLRNQLFCGSAADTGNGDE